MSKLYFVVFLLSMFLSFIGSANGAGGFLSQAKCNGDTFQFVVDLEVGPAPTFPITTTPILSGLCPSSNGQLTNSTLNLNKCLGNDDARLFWKLNGGFQTTCGCTLGHPNLNLCCDCHRNNGGTGNTCIDLNQGVAAANGQLNCDALP